MRNRNCQRGFALAAWRAAVGVWVLAAGWAPLDSAIAQAAPAVDLGYFKLTYYHVALEGPAKAPERADWPIYSQDCAQVIALTTRAFHHELSLEGTGLLRDGRLINFEERCGCARPGFRDTRSCYVELDRKKFPWGRGARLNDAYLPLRPLASVAVDPELIPIGSMMFLPGLAGKSGPGGDTLSGCFRAEDTGSAITGKRLDLFTGHPAWTRWMQRTHGLERIRVVLNSPRCSARGNGK